LDWLSQYGEALLSGSGGCVFLAVNSRDEAAAVVRACPPEFSAYSARAAAKSPLLDAVEMFRERQKSKIKSQSPTASGVSD
jgi:4-diphosphocytidyl-2-C-methyl-D-erythritol kinase